MIEIRCTGNIKFGELRGKKCNRKLGELAGDNYHLLIQCSRCKSMNLFVAPEPTLPVSAPPPVEDTHSVK